MSLILFILFTTNMSYSQINIQNQTEFNENFDSMGISKTLPNNWKIIKSSSPLWNNATSALTQVSSSGSPTAGGSYNWGSDATDRAVGIMTSGSWSNPNSLLAYFKNIGNDSLKGVILNFDIERYRRNTSVASVQLYYSYNGSQWKVIEAGNVSADSLPTGSSAYGFNPINKLVKMSNINVLFDTAIATGCEFYLRWNMNTTGSNSQGIGIDNVSLIPSFSTKPEPPLAINNISISNITDKNAFISWDKYDATSKYMFRIRPVNGLWNYFNVNNSDTCFKFLYLQPATQYEVHIRRFKNDSVYTQFYSIFFETEPSITNNCVLPNISISDIETYKANINFQNDTIEGNYLLRIKQKDNQNWQYYNIKAYTECFIFNGLSENTSYVVQLRKLCNNNFISDFSKEVEFRTKYGCGTPQNLITIDTTITASKAVIKWDGVGGAEYFLIRYKETEDLNWKYIWVNGNTDRIQLGCDICNDVDKLKSLTTYQWQVRAFCNVDKTRYSNFTELQSFETMIKYKNVEVNTTNKQTQSENEFFIYPNPIKNNAQINYSVSQPNSNVSILLCNIKGEQLFVVYNSTQSEGKYSYNFSSENYNIAEGIYIMQININGNKTNKKIIINK